MFIIIIIISLPVVPGQAGGGSFQKEKNYIAQKSILPYRMCARRPTSAMPKLIFFAVKRRLLPFHGGGCFLCFEVKCFDVLMSVAGLGHVMVTSFDAM